MEHWRTYRILIGFLIIGLSTSCEKEEVEWVDDYGQSSYKKAVLIVYDSDGKEILPIKIDSINPSKDIM